MKKIDIFKRHLEEKRAIKISSGMENYDIEFIKQIIYSSQYAKASAIEVPFDENIISVAMNTSSLPVFVSSLFPEKLKVAIDLGVDAIEIGNFKSLLKKGIKISSVNLFKLAQKVKRIAENRDIFISITIPGYLPLNEQISLAQDLEVLGINLIQTESYETLVSTQTSAIGLLKAAENSIANTIELSKAVNIPIMTSSGLSPLTSPMAFVAGASAIAVGSCINRCDNLLSMLATTKAVVESVNKVTIKSNELVNNFSE